MRFVQRWIRQSPRVAMTTYARWSRHDGWVSTAALAFHATLAMIPCCLVMVAVLGWGLRSSGATVKATESLVSLFKADVSPFLARQIETVLENVRDNAGGGGLLGLAGLLFAAMGMFSEVDYAFSRVWDVPVSSSKNWLGTVRQTLLDRLLAAGVLLFMVLCVVLLFVLNSVISAFGAQLAATSWGPTVLSGATLAIGPILTLGILTLLYRVFSPVKIRWRHTAAAGVVTTILWEFGRRALEWLVIGERYSVYGVLGSLLALMVWIYYASAALLLGAELARTLEDGVQPLARSPHVD